MKFTISKTEFLKSLSLVQGVVEKRNTMPILGNVLIKAEENDLEIMATDLEIGIKVSFNASVEEKGSITFSAKKLFEIVRELPDKDILFEDTKDNWIKILCDNDNIVFNLAGISAEEFPSFPSFQDVNFIEIEEKLFKDMIEKTIFSSSTEETRFNLNGIFIEVISEEKDTLRMVATDGHRLSMVDRKLSKSIPFDRNIIVPRKGFQEIRKILEESEEMVYFGIIENNCIFQKNKIILFIRLIDGEFPDYNEVIPTQNKNIINIKKDKFNEGLKRISLISSEKYKGILFDIKENLLRLSSNNPDIGDAEELINAKYQGEPVVIGFNARYFLDILNVIESEDVNIEFNDSESPGMLRIEDDPEFIAVVMPMRV